MTRRESIFAPVARVKMLNSLDRYWKLGEHGHGYCGGEELFQEVELTITTYSSRRWFLAFDAIIVNNFPSSSSGFSPAAPNWVHFLESKLRCHFAACIPIACYRARAHIFDVTWGMIPGNYPREWANYTAVRGAFFVTVAKRAKDLNFWLERRWVKHPVCRIVNFMILYRSKWILCTETKKFV